MVIKLLIILIPLVVAAVWGHRVIKDLIPKKVALALMGYGFISTVVAWGITFAINHCDGFSRCIERMDSRLASNMGLGIGLAIAGAIELFRRENNQT